MRYYKIRVTRPSDGWLAKPNLNGQPGFTFVADDGSATYSSLNAGATAFTPGGTNMSALAIDCDITAGYLHQPAGNTNSYVCIHGVGLGEIGQASNLNFCNVSVELGMAKGLPLANPTEAGRIVSGQVLKCFGAWLNGDQWLAIYVAVGGSSPTSNQTTANPISYGTTPLPVTNSTPANLVFQWQPGQPLLTPLVNCLQIAFPKYSIRGSVNPGLVWSGAPSTGYFNTLNQLSEFLNKRSQSMIKGYAPAPYGQQYPGVYLTLDPRTNTIVIADGTTPTTPKLISFLDLVGQPTWVAPFEIQVTTAMRGDIGAGDYLTLPPLIGQIGPNSGSQFGAIAGGSIGVGQSNGPGGSSGGPNAGSPYGVLKNSTAFTGTFLVTSVRCVGASRNPSAEAWTTLLDCLSLPAAAATPATSTSPSQLPLLASPNQSYSFHLPT